MWLIYKLLDDESKRVIVEKAVEELIPKDFLYFQSELEKIAAESKLFPVKTQTKGESLVNLNV